MSITVNLYYTGKNGSAKKFVEEMVSSGTVEAIRKEPGNEKYDYFQSLDDPETILLIDSWKDQEAIKALKQQTKENAVSKEDVQRLKELQEILNYNSIVDWLESMNSVISNLPEGAEQLKFDLCLLNRFFINLLKIDMYSQKDAHQTNKES